MQLSNYFSFEGRIGRLSYLKRQLAFALLLIPVGVAMALLLLPGPSGLSVLLTLALALAYFAAQSYFSLAQGAKRAHDLGHSGWIQLLYLVPVLNFFFSFYLYLAPGHESNNVYGAPAQG